MLRKLIGIAGVLTALVSAMFCTIGLSEIFGGVADGASYGLTVFFLGTGVLGGVMAWRTLFRKAGNPTRSAEAREQLILGYAAQHGGRVTVAEIALGCQLSVAESKAALEQLSAQGVAELLFDESGSVVYGFRGLGGQAVKDAAQDPLADALATPGRRQGAAR